MSKQWCIPPQANAEFVCAMEDVLLVYERAADGRYPLVCMDETSKQQLKETRIALPAETGKPQRIDHEYERNGVSNLFMFFSPTENWRTVKVTDRRTKIDWALAMKELSDVHFKEAERIVVVMDNLNTHTPASFYEAFSPEEARRLSERFEFHNTPKHGSWLNMAETELSILGRQCLSRRIPDQGALKKQVAAWENSRNRNHLTINWKFTVGDARGKLKHLYPSFNAL